VALQRAIGHGDEALRSGMMALVAATFLDGLICWRTVRHISAKGFIVGTGAQVSAIPAGADIAAVDGFSTATANSPRIEA